MSNSHRFNHPVAGKGWARDTCYACGVSVLTTEQAMVATWPDGQGELFDPTVPCGTRHFDSLEAASEWANNSGSQWLISKGNGEDAWIVELVEAQSC